MLRRGDSVEEEEVGVLHNGNIFQMSGLKRTMTEREEECYQTKGSDYNIIPQIEEKVWEQRKRRKNINNFMKKEYPFRLGTMLDP